MVSNMQLQRLNSVREDLVRSFLIARELPEEVQLLWYRDLGDHSSPMEGRQR